MEQIKLPSGFQINDACELHFGNAGILRPCTVQNVKFTPGKVLYDVEIEVFCGITDGQKFTSPPMHTRLYNVDSAILKKPFDTKRDTPVNPPKPKGDIQCA